MTCTSISSQTVEECRSRGIIYILFAVNILMLWKTELMIHEYWLMDPFLGAHQLSDPMNGYRNLLLLCLLQFVVTSNKHQVTYIRKPVIENLRTTSVMYSALLKIPVHESLVLLKGWLAFQKELPWNKTFCNMWLCNWIHVRLLCLHRQNTRLCSTTWDCSTKECNKATRKIDRQTSHQKMKAHCIAGYGKNMRAWDRPDMMISFVE